MTTATGESQQTGFDVYEPTCPARLVLEHVTSRWASWCWRRYASAPIASVNCDADLPE